MKKPSIDFYQIGETVDRIIGIPWFQIQDLARKHGIIALSSNYTLYGAMSNRAMTILRDYSPYIEVYSIDERFLDLNGLTCH